MENVNKRRLGGMADLPVYSIPYQQIKKIAELKNSYNKFTQSRKVASINSDGACTIYFPSFMPYNLYFEESEDIDNRLNNLVNFYSWCSSRVLQE